MQLTENNSKTEVKRACITMKQNEQRRTPLHVPFLWYITILLCIVVLFGCSKTDIKNEVSESTINANKNPSGTYLFSGENESIKITNGSIIFGETNEVFSGGNLEILQPDLFADISSYSTTFYTLLNNGERNDFYSTNVTGVRSGAESINSDLGSSSSNGFRVINLEQGLWFELITTDVNGKEDKYLLELNVIEDGTNPIG